MTAIAQRQRAGLPSGQWIALALPTATTAIGLTVLLPSIGWHAHEEGPSTIAEHGHHLVQMVAMALAMMSVFAVPLGASVARATLWTQDAITTAGAIIVFLAAWGAAAVGLHLIAEVATIGLTVRGATVAIVVACVALQLRRRRAATLLACARTWPVRPHRPLSDAGHWGGAAAGRCVRACGVPMLLTAVQPTLVVVTGVGALLIGERLSGPRPGLRVILALGYMAVGFLAVTVFG